jgi:hypothetical protein
LRTSLDTYTIAGGFIYGNYLFGPFGVLEPLPLISLHFRVGYLGGWVWNVNIASGGFSGATSLIVSFSDFAFCIDTGTAEETGRFWGAYVSFRL